MSNDPWTAGLELRARVLGAEYVAARQVVSAAEE